MLDDARDGDANGAHYSYLEGIEIVPNDAIDDVPRLALYAADDEYHNWFDVRLHAFSTIRDAQYTLSAVFRAV